MRDKKQRRHVRMFKAQFAPLVKNGTKRCTIRPQPKRKIEVGDIIDCREWTGKAYRSKQAQLCCGRVTRVAQFVLMHAHPMCLDGVVLDSHAEQKLAQADGFANSREMVEFFDEEHGRPFEGVLIEWDPIYPKAVAV